MVHYSEILKYVIKLCHNSSKLVEFTRLKKYSRDKSADIDLLYTKNRANACWLNR